MSTPLQDREDSATPSGETAGEKKAGAKAGKGGTKGGTKAGKKAGPGRAGALVGRAGATARAAVRVPGRLWTAAREQPRRAARITGAVLLVLVLAAAVFGWFAWQQRGLDAARGEAVAAAEQNLTTLLSYDYRTVAQDVEARQALTTGQFRDEYGALVRDVVTPAAARQQVVTQTTSAGSAVESDAGADRVTVLVFLNQTSTVAGQADPVFSGSRVRAEMARVDDRWLVARVTPV